MRERIKDDGKALTYLNLFADLGGELGSRLEVIAYDWNEPKILGEDFEHLPRLTEGGHRNRASANSTGQGSVVVKTKQRRARGPSEVERLVQDPGSTSSLLRRFRVSPVRVWRRSIRIPFSLIPR
jgi:hypothetical protein